MQKIYIYLQEADPDDAIADFTHDGRYFIFSYMNC